MNTFYTARIYKAESTEVSVQVYSPCSLLTLTGCIQKQMCSPQMEECTNYCVALK